MFAVAAWCVGWQAVGTVPDRCDFCLDSSRENNRGTSNQAEDNRHKNCLGVSSAKQNFYVSLKCVPSGGKIRIVFVIASLSFLLQWWRDVRFSVFLPTLGLVKQYPILRPWMCGRLIPLLESQSHAWGLFRIHLRKQKWRIWKNSREYFIYCPLSF